MVDGVVAAQYWFTVWPVPSDWEEENVLFNDALNTFYLHYMVSDIW